MSFKKLCSLFVRLTVAGVVSAEKLRLASGRVNRSYTLIRRQRESSDKKGRKN
jgi:hypothetical protein